MESCVDCIFRPEDEQNVFAGVIEIVGTQEVKPFRSLEELLAILDAALVGAVISGNVNI